MYRKFIFLGVLILIFVLGGTAKAVDPNLVGWWKFDEGSGGTANDSGVTGIYDGTINGATWTHDPNYGWCLDFDGTNDYVSIPNDVTDTVINKVTIAFWQNSATTAYDDVSPGKTVFSAINNNDHGKLGVGLPYWRSNIHKISWSTAQITATGYTNYEYLEKTNLQSNADYYGNWSHWAFTKSPTAGMKIYRNGTVYWDTGGSNLTKTFGGEAWYVAIGTHQSGVSSFYYYYKGKLGDVRVYNRELQSYEIKGLYAETMREPNLVLHYKFDEFNRTGTDVNDSSGLAYTGTRVGDAVFANNAERGQVIEFAGDDYITVPDAAAQKIDKQVTISFWHRGDTDQGTSQGTGVQVVQAKDGSSNAVLSILVPYFGNDGKKYVYWDTDGTSERTQAELADDNWKGKWNHWAFTKDSASGKTEIYLNGTLLTSGTGKTVDISDIASVRIGDSTSYNGVDGKLDDIRIYNKRLAKSEIEDIYNESFVDPNLLGWWKFDDREGSYAADSSGQGYIGTLTNGPTWTNDTSFGRCLQFDGSNDYVSIPNDVTNATSTKITISFWQYGQTTTSPQYNNVFSAVDNSDIGKLGICLPFYYTGGSYHHIFWDTCGFPYTGSNWDRETAYPAITDYNNVWSHWAFTKDVATGYMKMYRNGTLYDSEASKTNSFGGNAHHVAIGIHKAPSQTYYPYKGKLADFRIYNRCLSLNEVKDIYDYNDGEFIVLKGNKQATIVYPDGNLTGLEDDAYLELVNKLEQATGRKFVTMTESQFEAINDGRPVIYVGDCEATNDVLGSEIETIYRDGYMIVVEPSRVFLAGKYDHGTFWAVVQFLEDYVGVRYLAPNSTGSSLFTDVLPRRSVIIPLGHHKEEPVMKSREISGTNYCADWSLRQRFCQTLMPPAVAPTWNFIHNLHNVVPPATYESSHPEYYALINGNRTSGRTETGYPWQSWMCWSNTDTPAIAAAAARDAFFANPNLLAFSLAPEDSLSYCQCPKCDPNYEKFDESSEWETIWLEDADATAVVFDWINRAAKAMNNLHDASCDNKLLGVLAYARYTNPNDIDFELDPNILPYVCFSIGDMYVPDQNNMHYHLMNEWAERVNQWGIYDYAYGNGFILPRIYTPLVQRISKYAAANGGLGAVMEAYPNFGLDGCRLYQTARIWWNPDVNITDIFNDWNERMYREAAEPMKNFWKLCQDAYLACDNYQWEPQVGRLGFSSGAYDRDTGAWENSNGIPIRTTGPKTSVFEVFTPDVVNECNMYMTQAKDLAEDPCIVERLEFYSKCWDLGKKFSEAYWAGEGLDSLAAREMRQTPKKVQDIAKAMKKMPSSYSASYFQGLHSSYVGEDYIAVYPADYFGWEKKQPLASDNTDANKVAEVIVAQLDAESVTGDTARLARIEEIIDANFNTGDAPTHDMYKNMVSVIRYWSIYHGLSTHREPNTPQKGLLVHYEFDESNGSTTVTDSSSHGYDGEVKGNPQFIIDPERGRCIDLDGNGDYIYLSDVYHDANFRSIYKEVTVAFWMKGDNNSIRTMFEGARWDDGTPSPGFSHGGYKATDNKMYMYWDVPDSTQRIGRYAGTSCTDEDRYMNKWNHWVFTKNCNDSDKMTIYHNGTVFVEPYARPGTMEGIHYLKIGRGAYYQYAGLLDDFRLYDTCLDAAAVTALYNTTNLTDSNMMGWWKFDEQSGTTAAADSSGRGFHGTLHGNAAFYEDPAKDWCLTLDGSGDYVSLPNDVTDTISTQMTVAFWQYGQTTTNNQGNAVFSACYSNTWGKIGVFLPYYVSTYYKIAFGTATTSDYDNLEKTSGILTTDYNDSWSHWAFTKSPTAGMKIYRNGTVYYDTGGSSKTKSFDGEASWVTIGAQQQSPSVFGYYYKGRLSDVRLYNKALSQSEIDAIFDLGGDLWSPSPNPATWSSVPAATGETSIAMTATTASDSSGVEYYFDETTGHTGGTDSGWQDSATYTDTGLTANTQYTYRVQYRDKSSKHNTGSWSTSLSATTQDLTAPTPNPMTWSPQPYALSETSIKMGASAASDPCGYEYYFDCTAGESSGGTDSGWQDSNSYTDTGLSAGTNYTYRVRCRDKSANHNTGEWSTLVSLPTPDNTAPTPNPMTWSSTPSAVNETSITMTATTGSDVSGVEYYFDCTAGGGHDSGWQDSATYTDTGLTGNTQYTYKVQCRDKSSNHNTGSWSTTQSATTPDNTAPTPNPMTWYSVPATTAETSVTMRAKGATDLFGYEYYFDCILGESSGGTDSGWQDSNSYTDTGLTAYTEYAYKVRCRDKSAAQNTGEWSTVEYVTTPDLTAPTPNPATWATVPYKNGSTSISMTATTASDSRGVEYYFHETTGNPGGSDSGWQDSATYTDDSLVPNTSYTYQVKYRDKSTARNETSYSTSQSATTDPAAPIFIAEGQVASGKTGITPTLPTGIQTNDILLLFIETANQTVSISNQNGGTWTQVTNSPQGTGTAGGNNATRLTVFWSRYNGTQGNPSTSDSGDHQIGRMIAVRGCPTSGNPWDVTAGGVDATSDTSGSIPGATTTVANTLVVTAITTHYDPASDGTAFFSAWTNANLTSLTERIDNSRAIQNGGGIGVATGTKVTAGSYGSTSVTCALNSYKGMMSIALKGN